MNKPFDIKAAESVMNQAATLSFEAGTGELLIIALRDAVREIERLRESRGAYHLLCDLVRDRLKEAHHCDAAPCEYAAVVQGALKILK